MRLRWRHNRHNARNEHSPRFELKGAFQISLGLAFAFIVAIIVALISIFSFDASVQVGAFVGILALLIILWTNQALPLGITSLLPIIRDLSDISKTEFYSDCWGAYDGLVDFGAKAHYRVKHSKNEFAKGKNHINGIENFFASFHSQLQAEGDMLNID